MKSFSKPNLGRFLLVLCAMLFIPLLAWAGDEVDIGGSIETDNRFTVESDEESTFVFNENTLNIHLKADLSSNVLAYGSVDFAAVGLDNREIETETLLDRERMDPYRIDVGEVYLSLSALFFQDLDVRFGRQRIAWGRADKFNPTDNLNPDDFSDLLDFGAKLPSEAIQANYYLGDFTFTGVYIPFFKPSLLPKTDFRALFENQFDEFKSDFTIDTGDADLDNVLNLMMGPMMDQAELGELDLRTRLPKKTLANSMAAFKTAYSVGGFDMSVSYLYGRDDIPVPRTITMSADATNLDSVDVEVIQEYPRLHVIGADFAGALSFLWDVGVWAEGAYFIPERIKTEYFLRGDQLTLDLLGAALGRPVENDIRIGEDDPLEHDYFKGTAGFDYTFPYGIYVNFQYIRGLFNENTEDLIGNYLFGASEKSFLHDSIKIRLASIGCPDDGSWAIYPELSYFPFDAVELKLASFHIFGEEDTRLGAFGDDLAIVKAKVRF